MLFVYWNTGPVKSFSKEKQTLRKELKQWQDWFSETYKNQPSAAVMTEEPGTKWTVERLRKLIEHHHFTEKERTQGKQIFEKALCAKCHQVRQHGEKIGPPLTDISARRQRKEVIRETIFPARHLHEDYPSVTVLTQQGKTYSGMLAAGADRSLIVLQPDGKKQTLARDEIEDVVTNKTSSMPNKLLEPLSEAEVKALFAYILHIER